MTVINQIDYKPVTEITLVAFHLTATPFGHPLGRKVAHANINRVGRLVPANQWRR
jgi:hypothetical protein